MLGQVITCLLTPDRGSVTVHVTREMMVEEVLEKHYCLPSSQSSYSCVFECSDLQFLISNLSIICHFPMISTLFTKFLFRLYCFLLSSVKNVACEELQSHTHPVSELSSAWWLAKREERWSPGRTSSNGQTTHHDPSPHPSVIALASHRRPSQGWGRGKKLCSYNPHLLSKTGRCHKSKGKPWIINSGTKHKMRISQAKQNIWSH